METVSTILVFEPESKLWHYILMSDESHDKPAVEDLHYPTPKQSVIENGTTHVHCYGHGGLLRVLALAGR